MIKYIAFYDNQINAAENRYVITSCQSKMEYVISVLNRLGENVEVVSPSITRASRGYFPAKTYAVNDHFRVRLFPTFGVHTVFGKILRRLYQWFATNVLLYWAVKKGDTVIAYHSVALSSVLCRLKKRKRVKLILHVEEIYSDVSQNKSHREKEYRVFQYGDAFITPTKQLNEMVNRNAKPYAIAHGDYSAADIVTPKYDDGRVHCVYAGTFDRTKGGCGMAVQAARYLNNKYCLHIIGFGSAEDQREVEALIQECQKVTPCEIVYDGEKRGDAFREYIQKCHIGLSTQNPEGEYNASSFPSKILTYLVNGLAVVTVRIPVVETSDVEDVLFFYDGKEPLQIAEAIMECSNHLNQCDYSRILEDLDATFSERVRAILLGDQL